MKQWFGTFVVLFSLLSAGCAHDSASDPASSSNAEMKALVEKEPESAPELKVKNECEKERSICTREFKPSNCRFGDVTAKGNNRCEAMNALRISACAQKLAFTSDSAVCETSQGDLAPSPKKKRSR